MQEGREGRVERIRVVGVRQRVPQRERRQHEHRDEADRRQRGELAGARAGGDADAGEGNLDGRVPTCEFRRRAHPRPRVVDYGGRAR